MRIEVFPTHLRFAATAEGESEHHQHNASLGSITDTLRNQLLTAANSSLFTPGDFRNGKAKVEVYDYRFLNLANAGSNSSNESARFGGAVSGSNVGGGASHLQHQKQHPHHQLVPSIVEFELVQTEGAICQAIAELISREADPAVRERLLSSAAEIEARILVETEPPLCLDPSPLVERKASMEAYNASKYKVPVPPLAFQKSSGGVEKVKPSAPVPSTAVSSPEVPYSKTHKSPPLSSLKNTTSNITSSQQVTTPPSATGLEDRKDSGHQISQLQQHQQQESKHSKFHRLMLVSDLTNGGTSGTHGLMREGDGTGGASGGASNGVGSNSVGNNGNGSGGTSGGSGGGGGTGLTLGNGDSTGFQPRFSKLSFIEDYRKRKRNFDADIMYGLDTRKKMAKSEKKTATSMTEPEYAALNGMKVVRTVRFEQNLQKGTVYTILNIVETGTPDEYEAILRVGNEAGNAVGLYSGTLRYPVGNMLAVDNYLGYFKSFYGLTNKMTGVLVTMGKDGTANQS
ncbi:hypothetical protein BDR26DRAFT_855675 [Obelidium mucronatum]|nr:hypothetical protein BDR26DRAFT_855675 [Obelidium mucronatum]